MSVSVDDSCSSPLLSTRAYGGVILGPPLTAAALRIYYYFRQDADEKLEVKEPEVALIEEPLEQETYVEIPKSEVYERGDE